MLLRLPVLNKTDYEVSKLIKRVLPRKGGTVMFQPLDIFQTDSDGSVLWRGAEESFLAAKRLIEKLALSSPGEYLILNQQTGDRVRVMLPNVFFSNQLTG